MGSTPIPDQDMAPDRIDLLVEANDIDGRSKSKEELRDVIRRLAKAASRCPSTSCAFCEHMPRSEANREQGTTTGD